MKHRRLAPLLILVLAPACMAQAQPEKPTGQPSAPAANWPKKVEKKLYGNDLRGKKAPELVYEQLLKGKTDHEGKVVLIDFWATWCGPCRKAIPEINELQKRFKDDLVCIGISDEKPDTVKVFMKKTTMDYTQTIDTKGRMKKEIGVEGIPHVIIISNDGIVRWQGFPLSDEEPLTADIVKQIIDADPGVRTRHHPDHTQPGSPSDTKPGGTQPKPAAPLAPKPGGG